MREERGGVPRTGYTRAVHGLGPGTVREVVEVEGGEGGGGGGFASVEEEVVGGDLGEGVAPPGGGGVCGVRRGGGWGIFDYD